MASLYKFSRSNREELLYRLIIYWKTSLILIFRTNTRRSNCFYKEIEHQQLMLNLDVAIKNKLDGPINVEQCIKVSKIYIQVIGFSVKGRHRSCPSGNSLEGSVVLYLYAIEFLLMRTKYN